MSTESRYADDTAFISAIFQKLKIFTNELAASCKNWGMKVNPEKSNIITGDADNMQIDGSIVEKVERFTFLDIVVSGSSSNIRRRIGFASSAFGRLKKKNMESQRYLNATKN